MAPPANRGRLTKAILACAVLLLATLLAAPRFSRWHNERLAKGLFRQVESASDAEAKIPLRQLAELGVVAIEPLTICAASPRAAVATVARKILHEKVASWQVSAEGPRSVTARLEAASSTALLATTLAAHMGKFGPTGQQWAEQLALRMIAWADELPARQARILLDHCERILSAVPARGPKLRTVATVNQPVRQNITSSHIASPTPMMAPLTHASERLLDAPMSYREKSSSLSISQPYPTSAGGRVASNNELSWKNQSLAESHSPHSTLITTYAPSERQPTTVDASQIRPIQKQTEVKRTAVIDIPSPKDMASRAAQLGQLSNEELLLKLRRTGFYEAGIARRVLANRGFPESELVMLQQLSSPVVADRLRLIEDTSQLPAAKSREFLSWLLEDSNADVRLRALVALATTNAPNLVEQARELAVQDEDPRVAELASRLSRSQR